jgi:hypothetical protein
MAEDLAETLPAAAAPIQRTVQRRKHPAFRGRFLGAYVVLGALAGAAAAGAFVLFTQVERVQGSDWAAWHPVGEKFNYAAQIADHVSRRYRLPSGNQIAGVVPGAPEVSGVKVSAVAIQSENATSDDDIQVLRADSTFMYLLCGLGDSCTIAEGTPSAERHRLLRREALELALYTFKYVDRVDSVVVLMPPPKASSADSTAVFLEKRYFKPELKRPLAKTIERPEAPGLADVPELETIRVDRLTLPFVFTYEFQGLQNQTAAIILSPVKSSE